MTTATPSRRATAGKGASTAKARSAAANPYLYLSPAKKQELEAMDRAIEKITSSKEEATAFLKRAGIMDSKGNLAKPYRTA